MKKAIQTIWLAMLLLAPIVLWILPGDTFDNGKVDLCPSKVFFDIECFGCGITRAVMHFHNFQFPDAVYYNVGVILIYPILVLMWLIFVKASMQELHIPFASKIPVKTNRDYKRIKEEKLKNK